jgi:hypothetical protein
MGKLKLTANQMPLKEMQKTAISQLQVKPLAKNSPL